MSVETTLLAEITDPWPITTPWGNNGIGANPDIIFDRKWFAGALCADPLLNVGEG
jgi:hypothetical protein